MASGVQGDATPLNGVSKGVVDPFGQGRGFTPEALDKLTEGFTNNNILGYQGYRKRPRHVFAIVFGEKYRFQDRERQIGEFARLLQGEAIRKFSGFD